MYRAGLAELVGTAFLLMIVVGSGIMAERLAGGNMAVALLANAIATGAGLVVLIQLLGPVSGAHFNPVVTGMMVLQGELRVKDLAVYLPAQFIGAIAGVLLAHIMFELPLWSFSQHVREGIAQGVSESVATFGLILTILLGSRYAVDRVPLLVGSYITAAYWFTSSTSFANPAVTLARCLTDTFAGIRPVDVPVFVVCQVIGAVVAMIFVRVLLMEYRIETPVKPVAKTSDGPATRV